MADIPCIDLHPDKLPGTGPETALLACRLFLDKALRSGHKRIRIITGLGIHGDGTPRLRSRVEHEILPGYHRYIESQHLEQSGAVIHLTLLPPLGQIGGNQRRKLEEDKRRQSFVDREARMGIFWERVESAEEYLEEGDLRRAKLKVNQLLREFLPEAGQVAAEEEPLRRSLATLKKKIDAP